MGSEDPGREAETIEVQQGNAGEAREAARPRRDETVSEEELEEWQRELRTERRWAGPELEDEPRPRGADAADDVPPTETEEASAEP